jgi:CRISPR-associated endoribonuclease Cas6
LRLKITLEVLPQVSGNVLPISYQFELAAAFHRLITSNKTAYEKWLSDNGLKPIDNIRQKVYSLSNLYVPKVFVETDRLYVNVPYIQFWISFLPEVETRNFLNQQLLDKQFSIGDCKSAVAFRISAIDDISPVHFTDVMEYQSISPVVVKALRPNNTLDYLSPDNQYYSQFMVEELIERWESFYHRSYDGDRSFQFTLLAAPRRKAVSIFTDTPHRQKVVGYMLKFRLAMSPVLQEFAYICGLGDDIGYGFGYIELLKKKK